MIEEIRLRGIGVIAEATLPIGPGFTAITGETGAGKTMVVTGLGLLLGQRADSGVVRGEQAEVAGVWIVPEDGVVAERVREAGGELEPIGGGQAELYIGRTVNAEGRSRATVGGRGAPAGVLADLAGELVVVHGQSDQLRLRNAAAQRDALDRFGGAPLQDALAAYRAAFSRWRALDREAAELTRDREARAEEARALREMLEEVEAVAPQPGEDTELARRAERLANMEELRIAALTARESLSSETDAIDVSILIGEARRVLERAGGNDEVLTAIGAQVAELGYRASEIAVELSSYLADLDETGPQELSAVEERRFVVNSLVRKHAESLAELLDTVERSALRLGELDGDEDRVAQMDDELARAAADLTAAADELTSRRREAALLLGEAVTEEIHALALPDARLEVAVSPAMQTVDGQDDVAILLAPHPGAEPRPVARAASGGELSRVMLAIEVVIAGIDATPTFVFDEIDAGIGGAAAIEVGRRLARLAATSQVIAVTHLAQVAAFANNHLSVVKSTDGEITASSVHRLEGAAREAEMARLLSGMTHSESATEHARELLGLAAADD